VSDLRGTSVPGEAPSSDLDVFGVTDRGQVRRVNEDQFLIASLHRTMQVRQTSLDHLPARAGLRETAAHLLVVADGVGGHQGGELASGTAVEAIAEHLGETVGCVYAFDVEREHEFLSLLQEAVARAHRQVRTRHPSDEGPAPATTVTMAVLIWPRTYLVHIGDSRAYYLHAGQLRQLTRDQTAYEELVDQGVLREDGAGEGATRSRLRDVLTSAIGTEFEPSIGLVDLDPGDTLLLCTDGLTKHVADAEIAEILGAGVSAERSCRRLVGLTLERGASDNVTVIVGRVSAS
jgi:serine/threonine protein phosphatase PrpC